MIKKNIYLILIVFTATLLACIFIFAEKPKIEIPALKERKGSIALSGEWLNSKAAIEGLLTNIELNPNDYKSKLQLAQAYIQESRITGDHAYYDQAAIILLDDVLNNEANNFNALCSKATVLLSQHHFTEGLDIAQKAKTINPNSAFVYGILCDANVELGNYKKAIAAGDKMVSIRPDIRSYARISYLREIHGDLPGAIAAAKLAVAAGYPGLEQSVWARIILAQLYEKIGALDSAEYQYKYALSERPEYAFATAGLSKLAQNNGNIDSAIIGYKKAKENIIEYSFDEALYDCYMLKNETKNAENALEKVITQLSPMANVDESTIGHGHYADKELADIYIKANKLDLALKHAKIEYDRRPKNIDINKTMAWVYYNKGDLENAKKHIKFAMNTGCQNPDFLLKNALINYTNDKESAKRVINELLTQEVYIEPRLLQLLISKT